MQQTLVSKSLMGIKGSCFEIRLEYNSDFIIVHLPSIDKMSKSVFMEMEILLKDWWDFFKTVGYKALFAAAEPDHKINKLIHMLGFQYVGADETYLIYQFKE
jgi:hypothetical protein